LEEAEIGRAEMESRFILALQNDFKLTFRDLWEVLESSNGVCIDPLHFWPICS